MPLSSNRLSAIVGVVGLAAGLFLAFAPPAAAKPFRWASQGDIITMDPHHINETFTLGALGNVFDGLVRRGKNLEIEPSLATEWKNTAPDVWRFKLRQGVKFHDGTPFTAEDVVFSYERARHKSSDVAPFVAGIKEIKIVDPHTVDVVTNGPRPILTSEIALWYIMSKKWAEKNNAAVPGKLSGGEENFATRNANGTGHLMLKSREPDVKTVFVPNPSWWDKRTDNLTEVTFTPIKSAATRVASLLSGELDMMYPVPLQDVERVNNSPNLQVIQNPEVRTIFLGFDTQRDELLFSSVKGKNPFKDLRVRKAFYHAVDIAAIHKVVMRGAARPTGLILGPGINGFTEKLDDRLPLNPELSKKLLAEAGYPNGFEVQFDCPNDRYVNDEAICQAVSAMLAKVGIKAKLNAQTKAKHFKNITGTQTSFYLLGWTPASFDMHNVFFYNVATRPEHLKSGQAEPGQGTWNCGGYSNPAIDKLLREIAVELDLKKRQALIEEALKLHKADVPHLPLHQQRLAWGVKKSVELVQNPDDTFTMRWVKVK